MDKKNIDIVLKSMILEITKGTISEPNNNFRLTSFQMLLLISKIEDYFNITVEDKLIYRKLAQNYNVMLDYVRDEVEKKCQQKQ